ncbi:MAG: intradiol ring-cleavage dioxygenase [Nitrospinota bacterium]
MPANVLGATKLRPTPPQGEGPFYPDVLPLDKDNDLVSVEGRSELALGRITHIFGRIRDVDGRPVRSARIEIWQCDSLGRYIHSLDPGRGPRDPNFQGYGRTVTDDKGRYRFRAIKPVPYPGRTPHIHFAVSAKGSRRLTTQMYVEGEPLNKTDFLLNRVGNAEARRSLIAALKPLPNHEKEALIGQFDIVLGDGWRMFR